jgi:hypothetical protein
MKTAHKLVLFLFTVGSSAHAQVAPSATAGPAYLRYSVRYSQTADFYGGTLGDEQTTIASGNVEYANGGERLPFTLTYGGGYMWIFGGPSSEDKLFQHLLLTQAYIGEHWNVLLSDSVSYLPVASTIGFSGVPGTGEPVGGSGPPPSSSQSILTVNTPVIGNMATGEFQRILSSSTRFSAGGSSELSIYPEGNGFNTNIQMANAGLTRSFGARESISGQYLFSQFSYGGSDVTFATNTASMGFSREWSRKLNTYVSAGPQFTDSSNAAIVPQSTGVSANASVNYLFRLGSTGLTYSHGKSSGAGYFLGAESDIVQGHFSRDFGRSLSVGIEGSYRRTAGLASNGTTIGKFGGAEATRRLGRDFTLFANYTAIDQSSNAALPTNVLNELEQIVGFGIGYAPHRQLRFRH